MPLYEYLCKECESRFEILQRIGEGSDGLRCPECGGSELSKQFSTFASSSAVEGGAEAGGCGAPGCGTGFT